MNNTELKTILNKVEVITRNAAILLEREKTSSDVLSAIGRDIKLKADILSEKYIVEELHRQTTYPVLSEEAGWDHPENKNQRQSFHWVVDPLDGTYNFKRKIPFYAISVGLWEGQRPCLGVIYDIPRKKMFSGVVGLGAFIDGDEICVSDTNELSQAVLSTGFPARANMTPEHLAPFFNKLAQFKKVRMLGSAASSLALIASGQVDVHYEQNTMYWDVAAGIALSLAAGAEVRFEFIAGTDKMNVLATNKKLISQIKFDI